MLDITLTAPFAIGDIVARVDLVGGASERIVLRGGRFRGAVAGAPLRVSLTTESAPPGEAPLAPTTSDRPGMPEGLLVDAKDAFGALGIPLPEDGRLTAQLTWGALCHDEVDDTPKEGTRFGAWEHLPYGRRVGLGPDGGALTCDGVYAWFHAETRLAVGKHALRFGEIIALAGDFYAHLDALAARDFAFAWPAAKGLVGFAAGDYRATTLVSDAEATTKAILAVVFRDKDKTSHAAGEMNEIKTGVVCGALGEVPARRALALASQNYCHFGAQPADGSVRDDVNEALRLYRAYHRRAIVEAFAAASAANASGAFERALVTEAFGCHFLTDLFASGHLRVPRRALAERYGVLQGSLGMAAQMHGEENALGLWCRQREPEPGKARVVWRVFGDGALRLRDAAVHVEQVEEAVRRSVAEVFAVYAGASARRAPAGEVLAAIAIEDRAEALLPVPLAAGEVPRRGDVLPDGSAAPREPANAWPLYWLLTDGRIAERAGGPGENRYTVRDEKGQATDTVEIRGRG
jgi:hypothetical protein